MPFAYSQSKGWPYCSKATDEQPNVQPAETDDETNFDNTEIERDLARDAARDMANTSFQQLAVSPLKTHSLSEQRKTSKAKSKLGRACSSIKEQVAASMLRVTN